MMNNKDKPASQSATEPDEWLTALECIKELSERWDETECWHDEPFHDGEIHITTGDLHAMSILCKGMSEHIGKKAEAEDRVRAECAKVCERKIDYWDNALSQEQLDHEATKQQLAATRAAYFKLKQINESWATDNEQLQQQLAAMDALLREVLSVAYQTKEINRHPMLCLKEIRGMIKAKLEESR